MPSLEDVFQKIFSDPQWLRKTIIGGLLLLSVLGIPWVFGYFYRYAWQIRARGVLTLPEWNAWEKLLVSGCRTLIVAALYVFLPWLVLGAIVMLVVAFLGPFGMPFAMGMHSVLWLILPPAFVAALVVLLRTSGDWRSVLAVRVVMQMVWENWRKIILPIFAFTGFLVVGAPVFTFAFFLGTNVFIAYLLLVFVSSELEN